MTGGVCTEAGDADLRAQLEQGRRPLHLRFAAMHALQAFLGLPIFLKPESDGRGDAVASNAQAKHCSALLIPTCPSARTVAGERMLLPHATCVLHDHTVCH